MKRKILSVLLILMLACSFSLVTAVPVAAQDPATIEVSQPTYLTSNGEYDRNPSIINDGSDYWLFYTKGKDISTSGVRGGSYDPDADNYVVYYKTAATIAELAGATETKLVLSETACPADFDQRVASATYFGGKVYAFVSSGQSGTTRGLHYYDYDGTTWSGPTTLIADATARGGHVNVTSDATYVYIVWESSDGTSDAYTWDGTTLSSKLDISPDNQPKITLMGTTLYVVSIRDTEGGNPINLWTSADNSATWTNGGNVNGMEGFYDPVIFNDGTNLYVVSAPWDSGNDQQYLFQSMSSDGGSSWATVKTISNGGYGTTYWWDYWPIGYHDGSDAYVFFTTETDSPVYSDGEIAYIKMDWDLENDHYFYIQNAIDAALAEDIISVAAGIYDEQVVIDEDVTLLGANHDVNPVTTERGTEAIINGGGTGSAVAVSADDVTIKGFEITNGTYGIVAGAWSGLEISNNIIHHNVNNETEQGCGITIWAAAGPCNNNLIENNVVYSNERQGIFIGTNEAESNSTGNTVRGNKVYDNGTDGYDSFGIQLNYASGNTIENNEVYGHTHTSESWLASGIYFYNANNNNILGNNIHDNNNGLCQWIPDGTVQALEDNEAHLNNVVNNTENGARNFSLEVTLDALYNYWGDVTGPSHDTLNPGAQGNAVSDDVDFSPWLYKTKENFVSDAPCYAGSVVIGDEATEVVVEEIASWEGGWNSFSTPVTLDGSADNISELLDLVAGSGLSIVRAQRFDPDEGWVLLVMGETVVDYEIKPGEGFFIQVEKKGSLPVLCSTNPTSPPRTDLVAGWNLVGLSDFTEMQVVAALNNVEYSVVLSASPPNAESWSVPPDADTMSMQLGEAYWLGMGQPGILFGHTTTPVANDMTWDLN